MIKKWSTLLIVSALTLTVSACNMTANDNAVNDNQQHETFTNTRDNDGNLARDINNQMPNYNATEYRTNQNDVNLRSNRNVTPNIERDLETGISADSTTISSNNYPHTKAVLIQEAKYKHVKIDPAKAKEIAGNLAKGNIQFQFGNQGEAGQKQAQMQQQGQPNVPQANVAQGQDKAPNQQATQQGNAAQPQAQQGTQQQTQPDKTTKQEQQQPAQATAGLSEFESKVIELTNAERRKNGLSDLKGDTSLSKVAREKSNDMQKNNYFSHTSPTYGSPFDMMRDSGITYNTAGENIAQGQRSPEEVVKAWMNSEGHRKNILSNKFTHIGVGHETAGNHWTQMFIGK